MAKDKTTEAASEAADLVTVVVLKGKHLRHDGEEYSQNTRVRLSEADSKRLIGLGFVKSLSDLQQELEDAVPQEVSVTQVGSQTTITTSDPATPKPESGAA
ncbi:hypothetical protein [Serratia proteamaculans]|uniref:hypothetical protein n=1 Tax=Serratia proteamaculans TaxID=28151 RepID=UPI00102142C1|nr:hypothetical protein [Serratia proteamaculans]RYM47644.1 hypothetical protein BSQ97_24485 [Serratia proteamaculans]